MIDVILEFKEKEITSIPKEDIVKVKICNHCGRILYKESFYNKRCTCKDCYKYFKKLDYRRRKENIENE
ncbi:TPA: hypothetical protein KRE82_003611 [Clostridioides difficile]|nr:hypothetical protein [Clostridioides difficile]